MKYLVITAAIISVVLLFTGIYLDMTDNPLKDKFYGFGTIMMFLVTFPLFLIWRRNKTDLKKYVWRNNTKEDIKKNDDESLV
ncbi:hypothetical protein GO491_08565 [Flavobacteriaceae bacterium Ap0902]|nr:hypothetical protein [Flavobacteriaceae bacterium Ap0902]